MSVLSGLRGVLPREHTTRDGCPSGHREAERISHREQLALDGALDEAVLYLQSHKWGPAAQVCQGVGLRDDPRWRVGDPHVEHLAGPGEVVEPAHHLFDGGGEVPGVNPQQINVVGVEALQAGFHAAHHVLARVARSVGISAAHRQGVLGGNDPSVPAIAGDRPGPQTPRTPPHGTCWAVSRKLPPASP